MVNIIVPRGIYGLYRGYVGYIGVYGGMRKKMESAV